MNNYEYITACLPVLERNASTPVDSEGILEQIRTQCQGKDLKAVEFLLSSYEDGALCEEFYTAALKHANAFVREWFLFDLRLRNAKTAWLNRSLGRPEAQDMVILPELSDSAWEQEREVAAVLDGKDILERERGLDLLSWNKVEEMTVMDLFNVNVVLAFIVKLKIVDRWLKLDPETGKRLFKRLVEEIRNTK